MITNRCMNFTESPKGWAQCVLPEDHKNVDHKADTNIFVGQEVFEVIQKVVEGEAIFQSVVNEVAEARQYRV